MMARCLRSEIMFSDDNDRQFFLDLLAGHLKHVDYRCYAWVLMPNHYHIVVRASDKELSRLVKPLHTAYAFYHKQRYDRQGPLFWDRPKSIITQDQNYTRELVRYVHLNPVRAGICSDISELDQYKWSGHCALMGKHNHLFQDVATVLSGFGAETGAARQAYRAFLQQVLEGNDDDDIVPLVRKSNAGVESGRTPSCWIIGDREFVQRVISEKERSRLQISRFQKDGGKIEDIAELVAGRLGIPRDSLRNRCSKGKISQARKTFVYIASHAYRVPSRIIAEYCNVGIAAVSAMIRSWEKSANRLDSLNNTFDSAPRDEQNYPKSQKQSKRTCKPRSI